MQDGARSAGFLLINDRREPERRMEMNKQAQLYWEGYWRTKGTVPPERVSAWQFGGDPDGLAKLVAQGEKTATCSGLVFYELENEPLPAAGDWSIVLDSHDEPAAIIRTSSVEIMPMNEVSREFAIAEGEGDKTYTYWYKVHEAFFKEALAQHGLAFSVEMLLVCERFELADARIQNEEREMQHRNRNQTME